MIGGPKFEGQSKTALDWCAKTTSYFEWIIVQMVLEDEAREKERQYGIKRRKGHRRRKYKKKSGRRRKRRGDQEHRGRREENKTRSREEDGIRRRREDK